MDLVLDVGSGLNPRGDWNVDPYLDSTHRRGGKGPELDPDMIPNFVQAWGEHMPMFEDKQFKVVRSNQVIEHSDTPWLLLKEMWRVCGGHLIVECPSRYWLPFPRLRRSRVHISNFDASVFRKAIPLVLGTRNFEVTTRYRGMFHKLIPFPSWPHIIRVDVYR